MIIKIIVFLKNSNLIIFFNHCCQSLPIFFNKKMCEDNCGIYYPIRTYSIHYITYLIQFQKIMNIIKNLTVFMEQIPINHIVHHSIHTSMQGKIG